MAEQAGGRILRWGRALLALAMATLVLPAAPAAGEPEPPRYYGFQGEWGMPPDYDRRAGWVAPTPEQKALVRALGGTTRWTRFGTVHSLIDYDGHLATGLTGAPARAARRWIARHRSLFRLGEHGLAGLELMHSVALGDSGARVVAFRQTFGGIEAAVDGRITLAIDRHGRLTYVSSSAAGDGGAPDDARLHPQDAFARAAADVGIDLAPGALGAPRRDDDWTLFDVDGLSHPGRARLRALPTPVDGVRPVYETLLIDGDHVRGQPIAYVHFVDAITGDVLRRENRVNFAEPPAWDVFPGWPLLNYSSKDTRVMWCWPGGRDCERSLKNKAPMAPWDVDPRTGVPTFTTHGNAASSAQDWASPFTPTEQYRPVAPDRIYSFEWTNQWYESGCNPAALASPQRADIDAATANLFAMHNRMHDWSYHLGFTEETYNMQIVNRPVEQSDAEGEDPEIGNAQSGAGFGTITPLYGRDNANQITPQDGVPPITNMYLWQPIAGAFYPPCVDGDYDMAVIAHEYTHAISNRMVAGPDQGLSGAQAGAMGESWSDLFAAEYVNEYGFAPVGKENPFSVGAYVTGDHETAVRNYAMNDSSLNFSNMAYDFVGQQSHSDGEIWSAINFGIRRALNGRYDREFPSSSRALQTRCADGRVPPGRCPGNRRWIQIQYDAFLLMESGVSMVDARDAYLAADKTRFNSANQDLLWREFARGGLGKKARSNGTQDPDPRPSFENPRGSNGEVAFKAIDERGRKVDAEFYVGHYEARSTPIASGRRARATMVPGVYDFLAQAEGHGMVRFTHRVRTGRQTVRVPMPRNLASGNNGAKVTGDGEALGALIDDTESTNWTSDGPGLVKGRQATVNLAGGIHRINRVHVSAMLNDSGGQNRFSALRQFAIEVCATKGKNGCGTPKDFRRIFVSRTDAFPSVPPRPKSPHLILRSFDVPNVKASHVRLVVLTNQCTGVRQFRRDSDEDPKNDSSCLVGYTELVPPQGGIVRTAELQVFGR